MVMEFRIPKEKIIAIINALIIVWLSYYFVLKPLAEEFYRQYLVPNFESFYANVTLEELDNYNPLMKYGVSLKDLNPLECKILVYELNFNIIDDLSEEAREKAILHICSQIIYSLVEETLMFDKTLKKELGDDIEKYKPIIRECILYYQKNPGDIIERDTTPFIVCILNKVGQ